MGRLTFPHSGDEAARCMLRGRQESEDMPLEETIAILKVMVIHSYAQGFCRAFADSFHCIG